MVTRIKSECASSLTKSDVEQFEQNWRDEVGLDAYVASDELESSMLKNDFGTTTKDWKSDPVDRRLWSDGNR